MKRNSLFAAMTVVVVFGNPCIAEMTLSSTDITPGGPVPTAHIYPRCGGRNISPQLSWGGAPHNAGSFVLTMVDIDVKPSQWSHWIVIGLPANVNSLPQGVASLPGGARALVSNFGDAAYAGPCPPNGTGVHHYRFTVWALPTATVTLADDEKATELIAELSRRALDHASITGVVQAPTG